MVIVKKQWKFQKLGVISFSHVPLESIMSLTEHMYRTFQGRRKWVTFYRKTSRILVVANCFWHSTRDAQRDLSSSSDQVLRLPYLLEYSPKHHAVKQASPQSMRGANKDHECCAWGRWTHEPHIYYFLAALHKRSKLGKGCLRECFTMRAFS